MKTLLFQLAVVAAVLGPSTAQAQWWGPGWGYGHGWGYPYAGWRAPIVPPVYVAPPVIYVQPAPPPVIYVQPPPPPPVATVVPEPNYNAPPGYRWRNVWDSTCQCNRAVLIPQ